MTPFDSYLRQHDDESWSATLTTLLRSIHEVDRNATQIWFSFYPLSLFQALEQAEDPEKLTQQLLMQGNYYLRDQIDSSHTFLYGHRYWPEVKGWASGVHRRSVTIWRVVESTARGSRRSAMARSSRSTTTRARRPGG
jgi:hypothetical protein